MISKEEARSKIASLVERFEEQKEFYKRSEYNETLTRRDFIDPFFKSLGWDIDNEQGYAESYREVIHEDKIKTVGLFRIAGLNSLRNEEKQQATLQSKIDQLQNRIDYAEQRINEIVYELYGLTKEEIALVEGA